MRPAGTFSDIQLSNFREGDDLMLDEIQNEEELAQDETASE